MDENVEKILWILGIPIFMFLAIDVHLFFLAVLAIYCLYLGAYFRAKNWIIGWDEVKLTGKKVTSK